MLSQEDDVDEQLDAFIDNVIDMTSQVSDSS